MKSRFTPRSEHRKASLVCPKRVFRAQKTFSTESIETTFLLNLGRRDEHVDLITETDKVAASNSARFAPGTHSKGRRSGTGTVSVPVAHLATSPWHLVAD
jgi:hypothetical protein